MIRFTKRSTLRRGWLSWAPLFAAFTTMACYDAPVETPPTNVVSSPAISVSTKNKIDLLFMIDNSQSMLPMQSALAIRYAQFFQAFSDAATQQKYADLHVGVVTSDFGAAGASHDQNGCDPYGGGQGGRLQALGAKHAPGCLAPTGANFIHFSFDPKEASPNNLPPSQTLAQTFACMAAVGAEGCGYEHQLESVYAALHNNLPENAGFLRPDARLAIVFLTNEDDGSAPPESGIYDTANLSFGPLNTYRQTEWGVACETPEALAPDAPSPGALHRCVAAPNPPTGGGLGKEFDVARYIDFFTQPKLAGGVKYNPSDVILVGIDALYDDAQGLQVILSTGMSSATNDYVPCGVQSETSRPRCEPVLQHSCHHPDHAELFGDPAVRLNTVIKSAKTYQLTSVCDADYTPAIQAVANLLTEPPAGCVPGRLPSVADPDCVVEDWTQHPGQDLQVAEVPRCDHAPAGATCWRLEPKPACAGISADGVGLTVDRQGQDPPAETFVSAHCSTTGDDSDGGVR